MTLLDTMRPKRGDAIAYKGCVVGHVTTVEGNLCWHDGDLTGPFIWKFKDGLNALHTWPGKDESLNAFCPGTSK